MKITLTNDFHNTETTIEIKEGGLVPISQIKKAKNELCGIKGCACSNASGQRGRQEYAIIETSPNLFVAFKSNTIWTNIWQCLYLMLEWDIGIDEVLN